MRLFFKVKTFTQPLTDPAHHSMIPISYGNHWVDHMLPRLAVALDNLEISRDVEHSYNFKISSSFDRNYEICKQRVAI